jgi:hypothetical protein
LRALVASGWDDGDLGELLYLDLEREPITGVVAIWED